ncbi:hypothetical protein EG68_02858 [Paragonimus skrjabini miyazakii]|uniref:Ferritin n=1 Tax=Paragonimus skrjabini miyazakii TaxID=59628 RepID=A0A8S9Z4J9_9TREM|nr:hypothetical protein EG68_02858 [Paragonimus skrjabini miyazakii]
MTSPRTNFAQECENILNELIHVFWSAEQTYLSLSTVCASDRMAMLGFSEYFHLCCLRARIMAERLIHFLTARGGHFTMVDVKSMVPSSTENKIEGLLQFVIDMEKRLETMLTDLHSTANSKNDIMTREFIECDLLHYQLHTIKIMVNHLNGLHAAKNEWIYDTLTMKPFVLKIYTMIGRFGTDMSNQSSLTTTTTPKAFDGSMEVLVNCLRRL